MLNTVVLILVTHNLLQLITCTQGPHSEGCGETVKLSIFWYTGEGIVSETVTVSRRVGKGPSKASKGLLRWGFPLKWSMVAAILRNRFRGAKKGKLG